MKHKRLSAYGRRYQFEAINFLAGAIVLTLELTASRIVAPYIGLTIYVWTSIIGVILASLALGYLFGGRLADKRKEPLDVVYLLLFSAVCIGIINFSKDPLLNNLSEIGLPLQLQALAASCILFAPPTFLLGSISPYLARLSISNVGTSGTQISRISAAGTFGSLFGTFFTGFFLFSLIGTRNIMSLLGFSLIITSFFLAVSRYKDKGRLFLAVLALLFLLLPSKLYISGVSKDFDTAYNRYMIRNIGSVRILQADSLAFQSAVLPSKNYAPVFAYIREFAALSHLSANHSSYLVIGGGAFTLPGILARTYPQTNVDVVEIDRALVPISKQYFGLRQSANLHVFAEDGREYLNTNQRRYGIIYLDAYSASTPPFQLMTQQATDKMRGSLTSSGIVAVNIFAEPQGAGVPYIASIAKTFRHTFSYVRLFLVDPTINPNSGQNIILLASQKPLQPLINTAAATNPTVRYLSKNAVSYQSGGQLLSDDFAPVDQMVANQQ